MAEVTIPLLPGEIWRDVPGYVGFYSVSSRGRVFSHPRMTRTGMHGGTMLQPCLAGRPGYERLAVTLSKGNVKKQRKIHQLVMLAFVGPCPKGQEVLHLDGDRFRNHWPENLAYDTHTINQRMMVEHGTAHLAIKVGSQRLNSKMTEELVPKIRAEYAAGGVTERDLSAKYGVNVSTLHRLLTRQTWKHVA